ncbi:hypothetical protein SELMODRAFT_402911 [Selaginella moellendorffii]|uniref:BSD domain-containing protein n=1 Tax=Selaginella moellendorffii TaxID=88036 RepID=D8QNF3_SELML|nr:hypothetical protein SELMODRAFT_402911 [Selaginella moellendorffii]
MRDLQYVKTLLQVSIFVTWGCSSNGRAVVPHITDTGDKRRTSDAGNDDYHYEEHGAWSRKVLCPLPPTANPKPDARNERTRWHHRPAVQEAEGPVPAVSRSHAHAPHQLKPHFRRYFEDNVPKLMSEETFWRNYTQSEQDRGDKSRRCERSCFNMRVEDFDHEVCASGGVKVVKTDDDHYVQSVKTRKAINGVGDVKVNKGFKYDPAYLFDGSCACVNSKAEKSREAL